MKVDAALLSLSNAILLRLNSIITVNIKIKSIIDFFNFFRYLKTINTDFPSNDYHHVGIESNGFPKQKYSLVVITRKVRERINSVKIISCLNTAISSLFNP